LRARSRAASIDCGVMASAIFLRLLMAAMSPALPQRRSHPL
jgi:hypothetical protein